MAYACPPGIYEETHAISNELNEPVDVAAKLDHYFECLVLEVFKQMASAHPDHGQNQIHYMKQYRRVLGSRLGIKTEFTAHDPYVGEVRLSANQIIRQFKRLCQPENIKNHFREILVSQDRKELRSGLLGMWSSGLASAGDKSADQTAMKLYLRDPSGRDPRLLFNEAALD